MEWNEDEIKKLKELYPDNSNKYLSMLLNKTESSIINKAYRIGLKKSKKYKEVIINNLITRNKERSINLDLEEIKIIASKYKSRSEFKKKDSSVYNIARKISVLDEVCSHMIKQSFSIPQLILFDIITNLFKNENIFYNYRKLIKPYEVDIYVENKIALEYDGKRWHECDSIDKNKLISEKKIDFIKIVERNRNYEEDIKSQLIENINILNKYDISKKDIMSIKIDYDKIYSSILDINDVYNEIKNYKNISDLMMRNNSLYNKINKLNNYDDLVSCIRVRNTYSDEYILDKVKRYEYLNDFIKKEANLYLYIKRKNKNKLNNYLEKLKRKKRKVTIDYCIDVIKNNNIRTKYQLRKIDPSIYQWMKNNIGLDKINNYLV
jgi:urease gamma subunit